MTDATNAARINLVMPLMPSCLARCAQASFTALVVWLTSWVIICTITKPRHWLQGSL